MKVYVDENYEVYTEETIDKEIEGKCIIIYISVL